MGVYIHTSPVTDTPAVPPPGDVRKASAGHVEVEAYLKVRAYWSVRMAWVRKLPGSPAHPYLGGPYISPSTLLQL